MALLGKKAVIRYIANAGLLIEYKNKKPIAVMAIGFLFASMFSE